MKSKEIIECKVKPSLTMSSMVERARKATIPVFPNQKVLWVGWQFHFVVEGEDGNRVLSSLSGYAKGFKLEDYEQ